MTQEEKLRSILRSLVERALRHDLDEASDDDPPAGGAAEEGETSAEAGAGGPPVAFFMIKNDSRLSDDPIVTKARTAWVPCTVTVKFTGPSEPDVFDAALMLDVNNNDSVNVGFPSNGDLWTSDYIKQKSDSDEYYADFPAGAQIVINAELGGATFDYATTSDDIDKELGYLYGEDAEQFFEEAGYESAAEDPGEEGEAEAPPAEEPAEEPAPEAAPPEEPKADKIREKIADVLQKNVIDKLKTQEGLRAGEKAALGASDFSSDGDLTAVLAAAVVEIRGGTPVTFDREKIEDMPAFSDMPSNVTVNGGILRGGKVKIPPFGPTVEVGKGIRGEFPEKFQDFVNKPENKDVKDFLNLGVTGKLSNEDNKKTYKSLETLAVFLGVEGSFKSIAEGEAVDEPSTGGGGSDVPSKPSEGEKSEERTEERGGRKSEEEEVVKGDDVMALRFVISGTYKGDDKDAEKVKVEYVFLSSQGGPESSTQTAVYPRAHTGVHKILWPADYRTYDRIAVKVTGTPLLPDGSPGELDAIEKVFDIPKRGVPEGVFEVFNFDQSVSGEKVTKGVPGNAGGTSVEDKPNETGVVPDYYYDKNGRPKLLVGIDAECEKSGRKYTFRFDPNEPLIVPIMTNAKLTLNSSAVIRESKKRTLIREAARGAVPHWIFLTADMKKRAAQTGEEGRGGGGDEGRALGDPGPYNVAITKIVCKTKDPWIRLPQTSSVWDADTFEFTLATKTRLNVKLENAAPLLFDDSVDEDDITEQVRNFVLGVNEIWTQSGLNGWIEHKSVTGPNGITARRYTVTPAARAM